MSSSTTLNIDSTASVRRYRLSCIHGASTAATLVDRPATSDHVVVDILFVRHRTAHGCTCDWPAATAGRAPTEAVPSRQEAPA